MLEIIITAIIIATTLNIFLKRYHIPTIIGYIGTGITLSYLFGLHDTANNHNLSTIAEFGIVFLMFTIGLEFSIGQLNKMKKEVFLNGSLQVGITAITFYIIAHYLFHFNVQESIIIASGLSLSSTAIVLKLLNENRGMSKEYGHKSLGILLFQDLAVIPILLIISVFSSNEGSFGILMLEALLGGIILIVFLLLFGKYLLNIFFEKVTKTNSNEVFIGAILAIVMASSYIAHYLGLSYSLGALIAGVLIAETHYKHQVEADLLPFRDLLLGVFFVTVGMQFKLEYIYENAFIILGLLLGIIVIKIAILYAIARLQSKKITAVKTALSLFQIGEFGIVIFKLASNNGILSNEVSQTLIITIILSMILTPFVLRNLEYLSQIILKDKHIKDEDIVPKDLQNHIIVVGYGRLGKALGNILEEKNQKYIVIEKSQKIVKEYLKDGIPIIYGNAAQSHLLDKIHIEDARSVIVSVGNNKKLYHICQTLSKKATNATIIVRVNRYEEQEMLDDFKNIHVIVETEETALSMYAELNKDKEKNTEVSDSLITQIYEKSS